MLSDPDKAKVGRVTDAFMLMKKFDLAALRRAYRGRPRRTRRRIPR
jgi:hypothetical protein